jgi:hypothetical protein
MQLSDALRGLQIPSTHMIILGLAFCQPDLWDLERRALQMPQIRFILFPRQHHFFLHVSSAFIFGQT